MSPVFANFATMIRNIIFDYGSVLLKSDCRRVYTQVFGSWEKAAWFRQNILAEDWIRRLDLGDDYGQCIADLQARHPEFADAIAMYDTRFGDFLVGEMPGMERLLMRLRAEGYRLFGLSNYSHKIYAIERRLPVFRFLEGQIISSDVHAVKPDPQIFRLLLDKYSLEASESLFVDDRDANVRAAQSLGFQALLFPDIKFSRQQILDGITLDYSHSTIPPELEAFERKSLSITLNVEH